MPGPENFQGATFWELVFSVWNYPSDNERPDVHKFLWSQELLTRNELIPKAWKGRAFPLYHVVLRSNWAVTSASVVGLRPCYWASQTQQGSFTALSKPGTEAEGCSQPMVLSCSVWEWHNVVAQPVFLVLNRTNRICYHGLRCDVRVP